MRFKPSHCPNTSCPSHKLHNFNFIKKGFFKINHNQQIVRRLQCKVCKKTFSSRTYNPTYRQKKPFLNYTIWRLLCSGMTLRRLARELHVSRTTVERKFLWLASQVKGKLKIFEDPFLLSNPVINFDEMQTLEHTKCKPLSVALFVAEDYRILLARVAQMPCAGRLAAISLKKYGLRRDDRPQALKECFEKLKAALVSLRDSSQLVFKSDKKPQYRSYVREYFPQAQHESYLSRESSHAQSQSTLNQDEMHETKQKKKFDPIFALNQRCTMLRADIRRMTRKSWVTTKKVENLQKHLDLYVAYNNGIALV